MPSGHNNRPFLPFFYNYNFQAILIGLIGFVFYIIFRFSEQYLMIVFSETITKDVIKFSKLLTYICSISCIAMLTLKRILVMAWENSLKIYLDNIRNNVNSYIKERGPLTVHDCYNKQELDRYSEIAAIGMYGNHISSPESFYSFVKQNLVDMFCCRPHPSRVSKRVIVRDLGDGFAEWRDNTEYNIHHVKYDNPPMDVHYNFNYSCSSYAPGVDIKEWAKSMTLNIVIGGKKLIAQDLDPKYKPYDGGSGFYCWPEGDWICIKFSKRVLLEGTWTHVSIEEITRNSLEDRTFFINTTMATCNYNLSVEIPQEFEFRRPFVGSNSLLENLPESEKALWMPEVDDQVHNRMSINIKGWVLPGSVVNLNWVERS